MAVRQWEKVEVPTAPPTQDEWNDPEDGDDAEDLLEKIASLVEAAGHLIQAEEWSQAGMIARTIGKHASRLEVMLL